MENKNVFLYHLDNELQKLFSINRYSQEYIYSEFSMVTKVAFLICKDTLYIPASNYFESDIAFNILNKLKDLNIVGAFSFLSSSYNLQELIKKKSIQHNDKKIQSSYHYREFENPKKDIIFPGKLRKRNKSASVDIKNGWESAIDDISFKSNLYEFARGKVSASKFEDYLYEMPGKLGEKAYISDYITPLLPIKKEHKTKANYFLNAFITMQYVFSFINEYDAIYLSDIPVIDDNVFLPKGEKSVSYKEIIRILYDSTFKNENLYNYIKRCNAHELLEFRYTTECAIVKEQIFATERLLPQKNKEIVIESTYGERRGCLTMKNKIFIVHGHDVAAKETMARFLEKLEFEVIILHEQADDGLSIMEKIEEYSDVAYAVVLYTACDVGRAKNDEMSNERPRARQNVVFEHGYLIGKLSRRNVSAFVKGDIELPGDISGIVYIPMDDGGAWKMKLVTNLKKAGFNVDMNKLS